MSQIRHFKVWGVYVRGVCVLAGICPGGKCPGGKCPGGKGLGGKCLGGICPWIIVHCPGGGGEWMGLFCHHLGYIKIVGPNIKLVFLRTLP